MSLKRSGSGSYGSFSALSGASSGRREGLLRFATIPNLLGGSLMLLFLFVLIGFTSVRIAKNTGCLPPPYIYISLSDEHNILSITRDGCTNSRVVLQAPELAHERLDLRSMAIGLYHNHSALFVANAGHGESSILVFDECSYWNGMRSFSKRIMAASPGSPFSDGAKHAYGIAFDKEGNIYVSYQHTNVVLRASRDSFAPFPLPSLRNSNSNSSAGDNWSTFARLPMTQRRHLRAADAVAGTAHPPSGPDSNSSTSTPSPTPSPTSAAFLPVFQHKNKTGGLEPPPADTRTDVPTSHFPGTFVQFGEPGIHNVTDQGLRSIAWVGEHLWIANEDADSVFIVNRFGAVVMNILISSPIGIFYFPSQHLVFVGSKSKHHGGVYAYSDSSFELMRSFLLQSMRHPTGIVAYEDLLYVADQAIDGVVSFKVSTGRFVRTIYQRKPVMGQGTLEQLALSWC